LFGVTLTHPCVPSPSSPSSPPPRPSPPSTTKPPSRPTSLRSSRRAAPTATTHIAPILEKSCANCHDPKKAKNGKVKAGFDSSSLKSIVKGGKEAGEGIVWGDASKSSLYKTVNLALTSPEDDLAMPPKKSHEKNPPLTKEQVAKIKAFIEAK